MYRNLSSWKLGSWISLDLAGSLGKTFFFFEKRSLGKTDSASHCILTGSLIATNSLRQFIRREYISLLKNNIFTQQTRWLHIIINGQKVISMINKFNLEPIIIYHLRFVVNMLCLIFLLWYPRLYGFDSVYMFFAYILGAPPPGAGFKKSFPPSYNFYEK